MSLENQLDKLVSHFIKAYPEDATSKDLIRCLDLTLLHQDATIQQLTDIKIRAIKYHVAAVCVFSKHLSTYATLEDVRLATVINFPSGTNDVALCLKEIDTAKMLGAQEIDYVFPHTQYLAGEQKAALIHAQNIINTCKANDLTIIIIESGCFPNIHSIYELSLALIALNCDFIKTSTGTIPVGTTLSATVAIASAIKDAKKPCGLKLSGGIKSVLQAWRFQSITECIMEKTISPEWFRIGASSLLEALLI
jgi:deoxyribose-phosphate aldolase